MRRRWWAAAVAAAAAAVVALRPAGRDIVPVPLHGRVYVLTGATAGVGRHVLDILTAWNATVVIGARDLSKAARAADAALAAAAGAGRVEALHYDASNLSSVRAFAAAVRGRHPGGVAALLNNAGVGGGAAAGYAATADGVEEVMQQNLVAPAVLTLELLPALRRGARGGAGARVVFATSQLHRLGAVDWETFGDAAKEGATPRGRRCTALHPWLFLGDHLVPGCRYSSSKLLLLAFALRLARTLPSDVASLAVHPASAPTDIVARDTNLPLAALRRWMCDWLGQCIGREVGLITAHLATHPALQRGSGGYYHSDAPPYVACGRAPELCARGWEPAALATDAAVQDRVLNETCRVLGLGEAECLSRVAA